MSESKLLAHIIGMIQPLDKEKMSSARARQDILTKPQGSLGRLYEGAVLSLLNDVSHLAKE